ncbi:hypothetical protein [Hymenobacter lucidus]|uniref:Uncharacterized protein n=1 Tax=Hymenobacter lucidus TaxID=2880930 RepID=A0ABS8AWI1_9BACT|nr:hypothetical protein [Hymenobacter lucidus]MCB2410160.1 hypothetical protein [Hymenobacter lucidus]
MVVAIQEPNENFQQWLGEPKAAGPPLPPEYQELPGADRLIWTTHAWEVLHEDCDYPDGWPNYLLRFPHHDYQSEGRTFLVVQTGWAWVGQLPAA